MNQQEIDNKARELIDKFGKIEYHNPQWEDSYHYSSIEELEDVTNKSATIAINSEISNLARIQDMFAGPNDIKGVRIITGEIKNLMKIQESINKL